MAQISKHCRQFSTDPATQHYRRGDHGQPASQTVLSWSSIAQVFGARTEERLHLEGSGTLQTQRIVVARVRKISTVPHDAHFAKNCIREITLIHKTLPTHIYIYMLILFCVDLRQSDGSTPGRCSRCCFMLQLTIPRE